MHSTTEFEQEKREYQSLLASGIFDRAPNLAQVLTYVCEKYFEGAAEQIKEYNIAVEALGRPAGFDQKRDSIVRVEPEEAELAKLFTNSYRYIKFAAANQLFMMANDFGLDYERIRAAVVEDYPRAADLPGPGFAAGPCLLKDTMQLAAFNNNNFPLGQASVQINEGLPLYLTARMAARYDLSSMTVGILGMAFKGESDDNRSSLSYKLKRILGVRAAGVLTADPYVTNDGDLWPLEDVLARSDLIVIGAPHKMYADMDIPQPVVDIWNLRGGGVCI